MWTFGGDATVLADYALTTMSSSSNISISISISSTTTSSSDSSSGGGGSCSRRHCSCCSRSSSSSSCCSSSLSDCADIYAYTAESEPSGRRRKHQSIVVKQLL